MSDSSVAREETAAEPVRVVGGPLNGNRYAVTTPREGAVALESLAGSFIYAFAEDDGNLLLRFVGPAAPVVS